MIAWTPNWWIVLDRTEPGAAMPVELMHGSSDEHSIFDTFSALFAVCRCVVAWHFSGRVEDR